MPLFDKDDILEALFDMLGSADPAARQRLSRASDQVLRTLVARSGGAVVTSFWRHPRDMGSSGTPCDWLGALSPSIVEVHCQCGVEVALQRFRQRSRHPGHHDADRREEDLRVQFRQYAEHGPLGVGTLVVVDTSSYREVQSLVDQVTAAFER